ESILPEQVKRLEELILAYPEAEAHYVQFMHQFADLSRRFSGAAGTARLSLPGRKAGPAQAVTEPARPQTPTRWSRRRRLLVWTSVGLTGLAAGLLLVLWLGEVGPRTHVAKPSGELDERLDDSVAVLLQSAAAVWDRSDAPLRAGTPLPPGVLRLNSGCAHLQFYCGATVILEGPAELQL